MTHAFGSFSTGVVMAVGCKQDGMAPWTSRTVRCSQNMFNRKLFNLMVVVILPVMLQSAAISVYCTPEATVWVADKIAPSQPGTIQYPCKYLPDVRVEVMIIRHAIHHHRLGRLMW